jgi:hypothetical protein
MALTWPQAGLAVSGTLDAHAQNPCVISILYVFAVAFGAALSKNAQERKHESTKR